MTDYQNDRRAEKRAHKYRWLVWGAVPALFIAALIPWREIVEGIGGILWWSFGK